jgi:hypothetical protein
MLRIGFLKFRHLGWSRQPLYGEEPIMIKNGLYSLGAVALDGSSAEVGGILILRDGKCFGGDSYVYYTGTYECAEGKWKGQIMSREHTTTTRPMVERVQSIEFNGMYNDSSAEVDATVLVGKQRIRYDAALLLLVAS